MLEVKWKEFSLESSDSAEGSFNPCYVGSKMESLGENSRKDYGDMFQSLLCWK